MLTLPIHHKAFKKEIIIIILILINYIFNILFSSFLKKKFIYLIQFLSLAFLMLFLLK